MSKTKKREQDYKGLSLEKLREKVNFFKKELFNLRFQKSMGEISNISGFAKARKEIARIKTELRKRAL